MNRELKYFGQRNIPEIHKDIKRAARENSIHYDNCPPDHLERFYLNNITLHQKNQNSSEPTYPITPINNNIKNIVTPFHLCLRDLLWSNIIRFMSFPHENTEAQNINIVTNIILALFATSLGYLNVYLVLQSVISGFDLGGQLIGLHHGLTNPRAEDIISKDNK